MDAIRTEGLTKHYTVGFWRSRPYVALDALDLQVGAGEVFGFLGPNGAGKTTTLKLLMQLIFPTAGTATILGRPAGDVSVRRRIGYLPENPSFYDNVTAEELLGYFASLFGYRGAERTARVERLLDEVGLGPERRFQLRKYSKGMLQRVGLAQALVNDPELVILDEPMSGLDPIGRRDVRTMIAHLGKEGRTVLFSSHILSDAEELCERVAVLAGGRLVLGGRVAELTSRDVTGWKLTVDGGDEERLRSLVPDGSVRASGGGYVLDLPASSRPEAVIASLASAGARLESVMPRRATLEEVFVRAVGPQSLGPDVHVGDSIEVGR